MLTLADEEYQGFKTLIGELLRSVESSETTLLISAKLTQLYDVLDKRVQATPLPIGDRPAFPISIFPGMNYRQWLIGQALWGTLSHPVIGAYRGEIAARAVEAADAVLAVLDMETLDQKIEKEKPDA